MNGNYNKKIRYVRNHKASPYQENSCMWLSYFENFLWEFYFGYFNRMETEDVAQSEKVQAYED